MAATVVTDAEIEAALERKRRGQTLEQQAGEWSGSLRLFLRHAWDVLPIANPYVPNWHIDAICDHLEAVTAGEIRKLVVMVPPGTTKSTLTSICWPAWEWTNNPRRRHLTASYDARLATRFAVQARDLIESQWYQARWPLKMKAGENLKTEYANAKGGRRISFATVRGQGEHGDLVLIDDPHNAKDVLSDVERQSVIEWHDGTIASRAVDSKRSAEVIIAQRLHERDLIGHVLARDGDQWTVLCLPEEFELHHPFRTPRVVELPSGRRLRGDQREQEGELLCPARRGPEEHAQLALELASYRAAGQLQQRPAAREGEILQRRFWRFYPPQRKDESDEAFVGRLPRFTAIWQSWDTSLKDTSLSDLVAGTVWGQAGADLYLLPEARHSRLNLSATKTAIRQVSGWVEQRWPSVPHWILIEKASNGPEVIAELQRELRGIIATSPSVGADKPSVSKVVRAEAASPALEGGNIYLPGLKSEGPEGYDVASTPEIAQQLVEQCAAFPNADHDDLVDSFTQAVNWSRRAGVRRPAAMPVARGLIGEPGSLAGVR